MRQTPGELLSRRELRITDQQRQQLFAGGLQRCLEAGALAAAEIISHFGARPEADLKQLVKL